MFFPPFFTSSLMKPHGSNRSGPRERFACPEWFVEIINVCSQLKPAMAARGLCHPWGMDSENHGWKTQEEAAESDPPWAVSSLGLCLSLRPGHSVLGTSFVPIPSFSVPHGSQGWALPPPLPMWVQLWCFSQIFPRIAAPQAPMTSPHSCPLQSQALGARWVPQPRALLLRADTAGLDRAPRTPTPLQGLPKAGKVLVPLALPEPPAPVVPG